jgi:superfamily I DNA/RNA helicase
MDLVEYTKGLEFKCVIVPGLNEGILPHINSMEQLMNLEEERRLMYAAMSWAMERLIITYNLQETTDGASDYGGVEVLEGVGMRRGGMIGYRNHQVVIEWTALHLAPN